MENIDNRSEEEYLTLRQEMLELHSFCRNILYWTAILCITASGWFLGKESKEVESHIFVIIILLGLLASFWIYEFYMAHIYTIGSYLAVFWERREGDNKRWHRISRHGGQRIRMFQRIRLRRIPSVVYVVLGFIVFAIPFLKENSLYLESTMSSIFLVIAFILYVGVVWVFPNSLVEARNRVELEFKSLYKNDEKQKEIHDYYEL